MNNTNETKPVINPQNILQNAKFSSTSPMPETPKPRKHNNKFIGLVVLILLLIAGGFLYASKNKQPANNPKPLPNQKKPVVKDDELSHFTIKIATTTSESAVTSVPKDLEIFLASSTSDTVIKKISYENGKNGYKISFTADSPIKQTHAGYFDLAHSSTNLGWTFLLSGSRLKMDRYYFVETKGINYSARIDLDYIDQNSTKVTIQAVEN